MARRSIVPVRVIRERAYELTVSFSQSARGAGASTWPASGQGALCVYGWLGRRGRRSPPDSTIGY